MDYVRSTYSMPWLKRGLRVRVDKRWKDVVTKATHYVHVRIDGEPFSRRYHPGDVALIERR